MKRFIAVICALLVFPALAEVRPVYEEEIVEEEVVEEPEKNEEAVTLKPAPVQVVMNPAMSVNRAANGVRGGTNRQNSAPASRAVASRSAAVPVVRAQTVASGTQAGGRPISSRSASIQNRGGILRSRASSRSQTVANAIAGTSATTTRENSNQQGAAVQARAGSLYNATSARVSISGTTMSAGTRGVTARASVSTGNVPSLFNSDTTSSTSSASAEELAAQTDFCKAQYSSCMDQFCAVLDDNQGRCTCSDGVKKYEQTEEALKQATIDLQTIATQIRYLGLSKDEVSSLFTMTAAEEAMQNTQDTSDIKRQLGEIDKLLINPKTLTTTDAGVISFNFDDFDFGNGFDLTSLMSEEDSIRSQRGTALFETARSRCAQVITDCKNQGVDTNMIYSYYDLEIDKQCVAYERALIDSNDQMKSTIRNATNVLQQARLMVAQNKNKYDVKGCVNALDACMIDDFVCGGNYGNCLDSTGKYIVNGAVIPGSRPDAANLAPNWTYDNKTVFENDEATVSEMVEYTLAAFVKAGREEYKAMPNNLAKMLNDRIGEIDTEGRSIGMCSAVLNQCQNYTYANNVYKPDNAVVREYMIRTLNRIKASQDEVLASSGETCRQDIIACFTRNSATSAGTTITNGLTTAINACSTYLNTCSAIIKTDTFSGDVAAYVCPATKASLMRVGASTSWTCVDNTIPLYTSENSRCTGTAVPEDGVLGGCLIENYSCQPNYWPDGGQCRNLCPANSEHDETAEGTEDDDGTQKGSPEKYCRCKNNGAVTISGTTRICPVPSQNP